MQRDALVLDHGDTRGRPGLRGISGRRWDDEPHLQHLPRPRQCRLRGADALRSAMPWPLPGGPAPSSAARCCLPPAMRKPPAPRWSAARSRSRRSIRTATNRSSRWCTRRAFIGELFAPFAHHDVVALTESKLCTFARGDIERAIDDYPGPGPRAAHVAVRPICSRPAACSNSPAMPAPKRALPRLLHDFAAAASDSSCHLSPANSTCR
jgi:hypothetical protein